MPALSMPTRVPDAESPARGKALATIEEALEEIAAGRMVVVIDDEDRENEGDLVMAAERVTAQDINFMTRQAGGWICLALAPERCDALGLELIAARNEPSHQTPFTVTIDARTGITSGISTSDQAHTMRTAIDAAKGRCDLVVPGHVRPLRAKKGGVIERPGHTEAAVDLARLAGMTPAGVICEIQNEDGTMARGDDLSRYCRKHRLKMITISDLVAYRAREWSGRSSDVTPDHLRRVLGHLPTGVVVLTANAADGPTGMAANSMTSVSLDPPLVLVCPARTSSTWPAIRAAGRFCVNVLARDHQELCRAFATKGVDRFAGVRHHLRMGVPALDEAVAWLDCRIATEHGAGDHTIVVARVDQAEAAGADKPLVFFRGSYGTFDDRSAPPIYYGEGDW